MSKQFTYAKVQAHSAKKDLYVIIHDKIYDVTSFIDEHPGGEEVLLDVGGQDATEAFKDIGHSDEAREILDGILIGELKREYLITMTDPSPPKSRSDFEIAHGRPLNPSPSAAEAPFNSYQRQHKPTSGGNWFRYSESLTESDIRVFDLMPGLGTDQIRIKFYTSLMTASENTYAALSYTWNNSDGTDDDKIIMIDVNGELKSKTVTSNLEAALKQLRHEWNPRTFWVDALCINQDSSDERATQIPQMGRIYSQAQKLYIWLGSEADSSVIAMKFIEKVSEVSQIDQLVKNSKYRPEWAAFAKLMRRKWFNRRWVVQELHFGSRKDAVVHCGKESVKWDTFAQAIALFEANSLQVQSMFGSDGFELGEFQGLGASTLVSMTNRMFAHEQNKGLGGNVVSLEGLLSNLSMFQVSHPWDTVYAFLSLADNGHEIKVDYDKPLVHVLAEAVWKAIDSSKSVDILCRPWAPTREEIGVWNTKAKGMLQNQTQQAQAQLPSWIRDTTFSEFAPRNTTIGAQYDRINATLFVGQPGQPIYNASNSSTFTTMSNQYSLNKSVDTAPWILRLRGIYIDKIRIDGGAICGSATHGIIPAAWVKLAKWDPRGTKSVPTEFWHTLVASRGLGGGEAPNWYGKACEHAWKDTASWDLNTERVLNHCESSMTINFIRKVRQTVWNRQMFRTHRLKLLGLGPSNARGEEAVQHKDMIFIVKGCSVPIILRKAADGKYFFIGECYVHGLMGGNGLNMLKPGPPEWAPLQIL